jgi:hypothetical protein
MKVMKFRFLIGGLLFLVVMLPGVLAQNGGTRIKFKRGASSAAVSGTVAKGGPDFYLVNGKAGQMITVKTTGKVTIGIQSPSGTRLTEDDGGTTWSGTLPADGDYTIKVFSNGGARRYSMTVSIINGK